MTLSSTCAGCVRGPSPILPGWLVLSITGGAVDVQLLKSDTKVRYNIWQHGLRMLHGACPAGNTSQSLQHPDI